MRTFSYIVPFLLVLLLLLAGCTGTNIKDDFCGIHINFQYCKCAFHNQYCDAIGMSKSEAKTYVYEQYDKWRGINTAEEEPLEKKEYGVIEKDGNLYLNSKPGETLEIKTEDLPKWARGKIATIGMTITTVGPPDAITEGDSNVLLDGLPIARVNDSTAHGGMIVEGSKNIFVNGIPVAEIGGIAVNPMSGPGGPYVGGPIVSN